jgi:integrase
MEGFPMHGLIKTRAQMPLVDPEKRALSMAELLARIEGDAELSPTRKRDLASAVRSFCRHLKLDPANTPAAHAYFRRHVQQFHHLKAGTSRKTFQNARALVSSALRRYVIAQTQRGGNGLAPEWKSLWDLLRDKPDLRFGMSRLMRFCSDRGIAPDSVSDAVTSNFLAWLRDETFVKRPEAVHKRCLVNWNKCSATIPDWPERKLSVPNLRTTYCIPWSSLPPPLRADAEAWLSHLAEADPLSLDGPAWPARPATIHHRRFQIRQLVSALVQRGHRIDRLKSLRDLVKPKIAEEALRFFFERNGNTKSSQVSGLAAVMFTIAKHWCKVEGEQLDALARLRRNLAYRVKGLTSKNRARLRQFTDRRNIEALLYLPQRIYDAADRNSRSRITSSLDMQVAVAVELLLMMPIRRSNLVRLRFGPEGHIHPRQDRHGTTHIVIDGREVKNKQALEYPVPRESSDLLEIYIERFRPVLVKSPSYWVFPGEGPSGHKALDQFSRQFRKTIRNWTGLDVNIHLMRHIGAKLYLDENPGAYEVVRRVLGHKSLSTTVNNYTGLEVEAAVKHFDAVILGIRDAIGRSIAHA